MAIQLSGSLAITGSLTATSQIVAQTLNVQQVTSSIVYSSGSNIFGNSVSNTQQFTGSLQVSGSNHHLLGDVGLGTTSDLARVTILADSSAQSIGLIGRSADNISTIRWWNNAGNSVYTAIESNANYTIYNTVTNGYASFHTNNTERLRVTSGGDIGVGTSSPFGTAANRTVLSVNGTTDVSLNIGSGGSQRAYLYGSSSYAELGTIGSLPLTFAPNNTERMRITSGGTVLVNATTSTYGAALGYSFGVRGTNSQTLISIALANQTLDTQGLYIGLDGSVGYINMVDNKPWTFATNNTERLRITSGGNVGIGTTSPTYILDVFNSTEANLRVKTSSTSGLAGLYIGNGNRDYSIITRNSVSNVLEFRNETANTTVMAISGSNVGIGTTSPSTILHLVQSSGPTIRLVRSSNRFDITGDTDFMELNARDTSTYMIFKTADTERIRITSDGLVGVGTTNPIGSSTERTIELAGGSNNSTFYVTKSSTGIRSILGASDNGTIVGAQSNHNVTIVTNDTTRILVSSGGNVGIGTTSPTRLLELYGAALSADTPTLRISSADSSGTRKFGIEFYSRTGADVRGKLLVDNNGRVYLDDNGGGGVVLQANGGTGNVGIGTTSPDSKFHMAPSNGSQIRFNYAGSGDNYYDGVTHYFRNGNGASNVMTLLSGGNVGIGTTNPGTKLDVWGTIRTTITSGFYTDFTYTGTTYNFGVGEQTDNVDFKIAGGSGAGWTTGGNFRFFTQAGGTTPTERMRITPGGNVGIGTTSPSSLLHVTDGYVLIGIDKGVKFDTSGASGHPELSVDSSAALSFKNTAGSTSMFIKNDGNVGVGTTAPSNLLSVGANAHTSPSEANRILNFYLVGSELHNSVIPLVVGNNNNSTSQPQMVGLSLFNRSTANNTWSPMITFGGLSTSGDYMNGAAGIAAQLPANTDNNFRGGNLVFYTAGVVSSQRGLLERMRINTNGDVGIGTTSPSSRLHVTGSTDTVKFEGSGSNIFTVDGTSGRLFSVDDDLTNSLFSVNTIAGLPVIEAFADNTVRLGRYSAASGSTMMVTGSAVAIGTTTVSTEADLYLGAQGTSEGGQLVLQRGTSFTSASHLDNYQDRFRIMSGTDTTSTTERFSVDMTNGIVTTPFQPAFRAGRSSSYSPGGGTILVFNSTSGFGFNIGGYYNTSNGRFTAPVNGVYNFTACVIWESVPDGQQMDDAFEIRVNGSTAAYSFRRAEYVAGTTGNSGFFTDNATVLLNLTAGQYVEVYNRFNLTIHGNQNYCYFSGYLVG